MTCDYNFGIPKENSKLCTGFKMDFWMEGTSYCPTAPLTPHEKVVNRDQNKAGPWANCPDNLVMTHKMLIKGPNGKTKGPNGP